MLNKPVYTKTSTSTDGEGGATSETCLNISFPVKGDWIRQTFRGDHKTRGLEAQQGWHSKQDHPCSKATSAEHRLISCSPSSNGDGSIWMQYFRSGRKTYYNEAGLFVFNIEIELYIYIYM